MPRFLPTAVLMSIQKTQPTICATRRWTSFLSGVPIAQWPVSKSPFISVAAGTARGACAQIAYGRGSRPNIRRMSQRQTRVATFCVEGGAGPRRAMSCTPLLPEQRLLDLSGRCRARQHVEEADEPWLLVAREPL